MEPVQTILGLLLIALIGLALVSAVTIVVLIELAWIVRLTARLYWRWRSSSTPLGWYGWWLPPAHRLGQSPQAQGTRAGPTGEQQLQLVQYRKGGQADARTFGSSRCSVTKAWATDARVT